jgi:hypothetical protein
MPDRILSSVQNQKSRGPSSSSVARSRGKEKHSDKSQTPAAKRLPEVPGIPMRGKLWAEGNTHDNGAKKKQRKIARRVSKTILRDPFRRRC